MNTHVITSHDSVNGNLSQVNVSGASAACIWNLELVTNVHADDLAINSSSPSAGTLLTTEQVMFAYIFIPVLAFWYCLGL